MIKLKFKNFYLIIALLIGISALGFIHTYAVDGSGTNTVAPTSTTSNSTGNTFNFTFTAGETMDSGGIQITTPSGFSAPQGVSGVVGYTTAASAGVIANVINNLDSISNWATTLHATLSTDTSDYQEGTGSLSNAITSLGTANEQSYFNYGLATNWGGTNSGNLRVGMWLKSSVNTASGDFSWQDDNSASLASPLDTIAVPALTADTWTYTSVTLGATTRTSQLSYGFRYTNDIGAVTLKADSLSTLFDAADSTTNWKSDGSITRSLLNTAGNFKEGTAAIRCAYASGAGIGTAGQCYSNNGSDVFGPGGTVSFWIRSSINLNAGDFVWKDDNSADFASPLDTVDIPALTANTWTYLTLSAPNSSNITEKSYGLERVMNTGAVNIDIDAMGKVIDTCDSTTGWTGHAAVQTLSSDTSVFHEGTASLKNILATGAVSGDKWYETLSASQNWSNYTTIGFWIRSTVNTSVGNLQFEYDDNNDLSSPIASLNIGALTANAWSFQKLTLTGARTSINSYGIKYVTNIGATTINLDDILIGPGSITFPGSGVINTRILSLANGETITVAYGSGGGTSGVTAPSTAGVYTATTTSRISDSGTLTNISSQPTITVQDLPATKFVILDPTDGTVDSPITITIQAQDVNSNVKTNYQNDVTLVVSGTSVTGGGLINIINGIGTTTISTTLPQTINLSLSDTQSAGLDVSSTQSVIVSAGATATLSLNDVSSMTAGERAAYTVIRKDQYNNLVTSGAQTFYLYSNAASGYGFYNAATAGNLITSITVANSTSSAQFWYYDATAATPTITVSDNSSAPDGNVGIDDATDQITVNSSAVTQFLLNAPANITAGNRAAYTITRKDTFGNLATVGTSTAYLYSDAVGANDKFYDAASAGNIITSINISNGNSSANFWYYDEVAGTINVTVSDNSSTPDGNVGIDDATDQISITSAAVSQYLLNDPSAITAGTRATYTVTRKDAFNNLVTSGSNTVYLYSSSASANKKFYDAATEGNMITSIAIIAGSSAANFWYYDDTAATITITASDNSSAPDGATGIIDATDSLTINSAPVVATRFVIEAPASATVGNTVTVTIKAKDNAGSVDTTYNNSVTLVTSGSATVGGLVTVSNGVGSINITDNVAETVNLSLSDTQVTGLNVSSTASVIFSPGPVSQFILNAPSDITAGTRAAYTVTRKDQFGNLVISGNTSIYLYSNSGSAVAAFYDDASAGNQITSVSIGNNSSSASFWYYEGVAGTWNITASDNNSVPDGSTGITDAVDQIIISPVAVSQFLINNPGNMTAGTRLGYTVTRKDQFNNLVTGGSTTVYLYSSANSTSTAFYSAATGGSAINNITIADGASTANFWYYEEAAGTWTVTVSDSSSSPNGAGGITDASQSVVVSAIPITATRFVFFQVNNSVVNTAVTVTIRAEDNNGNVDANYQNDVRLNASGSATGEGLIDIVNGVGTATLNDGAAEAVILSLTDTQATGLNVSSVATITFSAIASAVIAPTTGSALSTATIVFYGKAFPNALLTVVLIGNERIPVRQTVAASDSGDFLVRFTGVNPGVKFAALTATDVNNRAAQSKIFSLTAAHQLIIENVFLPPTVGILKRAVLRGGFLGLNGYAAPGSAINMEIDGNIILEKTAVNNDGSWKMTYNTFKLGLGEHKVRVRQISQDGIISGFSLVSTFVTVNQFVPESDLNGDGRVNASDLSIFISRWFSSDKAAQMTLDFNHDDKVDVQDLSIFSSTLK